MENNYLKKLEKENQALEAENHKLKTEILKQFETNQSFEKQLELRIVQLKDELEEYRSKYKILQKKFTDPTIGDMEEIMKMIESQSMFDCMRKK